MVCVCVEGVCVDVSVYMASKSVYVCVVYVCVMCVCVCHVELAHRVTRALSLCLSLSCEI